MDGRILALATAAPSAPSPCSRRPEGPTARQRICSSGRMRGERSVSPNAADRLSYAAGTRPGATGARVAIFHALRGLYAIKLGRNGDAQRDLEIAAESPTVEAKAAELDDPRSSLAPQVVAAKRADER